MTLRLSRSPRAEALAAISAILLILACRTPSPSPPTPPAIETTTTARYERVSMDALPRIEPADLTGAWPAWRTSCEAFDRRPRQRALWHATCEASRALERSPDARAIQDFLAAHFDAWRLRAETREKSETGPSAEAEAREAVISVADRGRITGYYEPLLAGSRVRSERYSVPLRRRPEDLLIVELGSLYPELAGKRVRGRLIESPEGRRVVPYATRAELERPQQGGTDPEATRRDETPIAGTELLWVEDAVEAFFLHVQGSGRVQFPDGSQVRVGYADTNGHPYRSIGAVLIERGELRFEQASMQGIQAWARAHPDELRALLDENPSYVFFRELAVGDPKAGPVGALNVPLTPGYSLASDPRFIPLGAPVLIETEHPSTGAPLTRVALVQDTGGAIRGPIRFDFFWGFGAEAGAQAGRQRHEVSAWLLLPKGVTPEAALGER